MNTDELDSEKQKEGIPANQDFQQQNSTTASKGSWGCKGRSMNPVEGDNRCMRSWDNIFIVAIAHITYFTTEQKPQRTDFRRTAHSLLFWDINFDMKRQDHWYFFGAAAGRGKELCSSAKSLYFISSSPECRAIPTPIASSGRSLPKIRFLHLGGSGFPQSEFLEPFSTIQSVEFLKLRSYPPRESINLLDYVHNSKLNLKHISFGVCYYIRIVDKYDKRPQIELGEVPQLETLSFTIRFPQNDGEWATWFSWLGLQIRRSPPPNFWKVKITTKSSWKTNPYGKDPLSQSSPDNEFDALAEDPNIKVSICFVIQTQWSEDDSKEIKAAMDYERAVKAIKDVSPSWWNLGRLEIVREWL
ncbi:hypothetical protein DL96DRAFT_1681451 [Flagelloscypha sp. PMI_526]|nr:hypothetical protein DL96DRAFT_1681451 [Flagelloscypha sp. PMI_526]